MAFAWKRQVREIRTVPGLAAPVALAELGWMAMSVVDTIMVGNLGPVAIGAISIGSAGFYAFGIFGIGLMLGLDTLVSQAFGRGDFRDARRSLHAAVWLALLLSPVLMAFFYFVPELFAPAGIAREIVVPAARFLRALSLSTLPLLLYGAFRRYLQATGHARLVTFALITANLVNWGGNWLLIEGHDGFPALGVVGSALSTVAARIYMAGLLGCGIWFFERGRKLHAGARPDWHRIRELISIGAPAAAQILLEIGAFSAAAFLAGRLSTIALAGHQIAINVASVTFMVPLGIASAAAITVGHALGRGQPALARHHGFIALGIAVVYEIGTATCFLVFPRQILALYTTDAQLTVTGIHLLQFAAAFQLFDGLQTVATGALRGLGNTKAAMIVNLCGYWFFGLPLGAWICFAFGWGIYGIWFGLTLSLIVIAVILCREWTRRSQVIRVAPLPPKVQETAYYVRGSD